MQAPTPRETYVAGGYTPPYDLLASIATKRIHDPEYWGRRADEAREIASPMTHHDTRSTMLRVAELYEDLAQKAERRLAKNPRV
jgi:hypothetical protein